jgi:ubiquinone/menaquinone biosynthesis C-methylase UbiE
MGDESRGQVTGSAAEVYEAFFVPALFSEWAPRMVTSAALAPGEKVLDVATGTGVLAREASRSVGPMGAVVGLDCNEAMLAVARRTAHHIEWCLGRAESIPFADNSFDAVLSQFGLMFFEDQARSLAEMWRVLRPRGHLAVAVWDALEHSPGYAAMAALVQRLFGPRIADELRAPFRLGHPETLQRLFTAAKIPDVEILTFPGTARFPSIEAWVHTDVKGWTLGPLIDEAQYEMLRVEAEKELNPFVQRDGTVVFDDPAHIAIAIKS